MNDENIIPTGAIPMESFEPGFTEPTTNVMPTLSQNGIPEGAIPESDFQTESSEFETIRQQALTVAEGLAKGVAGPLATGIQTKILGQDPEKIRKRKEANPTLAIGSEIAGLGASAFIPGGQAKILGQAGKAVQSAVGLLTPVSTAAKLGSAVVREAVEGAAYQIGDEVSKRILKDPNTSAESAISNIGLAAITGGLISGSLTGVGIGLTKANNALWKATKETKVAQGLGALRTKLDGVTDTTLIDEAAELGLTVDPVIIASMGDDITAKNMALKLSQTDATSGGISYQQKLGDIKTQVANKTAELFGNKADDLTVEGLSKYESGKEILETLSNNYNSKMTPIVKVLEETKDKFKNVELEQQQITRDFSNPYKPVDVIIPGTSQKIAQKIQEVALDEGFLANVGSEEARFIKNTLRELNNKKTIGDLVKLETQIGKNTKSTLPFGQQTNLSRAGQIVKNIIRDEQNDIMLKQVGKEAPEALESFRNALNEFKEIAKVKDSLNDILKIGGSVSGFAKGLKNAANTDAESMLKKIIKDDVYNLNVINNNFPEVAQLIKQYKLNELLKKGVSSAKEGFPINIATVNREIEKLSPEMKEFVFGQEKLNTLKRLTNFEDKLKDYRYNFSNTGRKVQADLLDDFSTGAALAGVLATGSPLGVLAFFAPKLLKEGMDAARLGLLKFMGSERPTSAAGFQAAIDYFENTLKAAKKTGKAIKNVFDASQPVLVSNAISDKDIEKLDKNIDKLIDNQEAVLKLADDDAVGTYLPDEQAALTQTASSQMQYLASLRPKTTRNSPLDKEMPASKADIQRYHKALEIAQEPIIVLDKIKKGTLQPTDVQDLQALYPNLYTAYVDLLMDNVANHLEKDQIIPYKTKMSLSLFLGQPMDTTLTPQSIQTAQIRTLQQPQPQQMPKSTKNLGKSNPTYMTPSQKAEERHKN